MHIQQMNRASRLTPAKWKWAAPEGWWVSQDAFDRHLSNEPVAAVTDKRQWLTREVEPFGQDLVTVFRKTRVFTGHRFLSCRRRRWRGGGKTNVWILTHRKRIKVNICRGQVQIWRECVVCDYTVRSIEQGLCRIRLQLLLLILTA